MPIPLIEAPQRTYARIAGFMYLFVIALYGLGLFMTVRIRGGGEFLEAAQRIVASETLYRVGLCLLLSSSLFTIWLAVGLYVTLRPVDKNLALVALLCRVAETILGGMTAVAAFALLQMRIVATRGGAFSADQLHAWVDVNAEAYRVGFNTAIIFFSMGSIIFFYLFVKSRYIPRFLSAFGVVASVIVTLVGFTSLILPRYSRIAAYGWGPIAIAEIITGLWLWIVGIKDTLER